MRFYKKCIVLIILLVFCGCRHLGPYNYETYAPIRETLSFVNDSMCVHTRYDISKRDSIAFIDTCYWKYGERDLIILYNIRAESTNDPGVPTESATLNFVYDIFPKWYNIKEWEFYNSAKRHPEPLYQIPGYKIPSFLEKFGRHHIVCDTIINNGSCIWWFKRPVPTYAFPRNKHIIPKEYKGVEEKEKQNLYEWACGSYEYLNYKINKERKVSLDQETIIGRQFSFIGEEHKKESIRFVNDTICTHSFFTRTNSSSLYVLIADDTCHYSVKNNLIAIDFDKDTPCDTLSFSNGILFYSKVYQDNKTKKYTHVFIDENVKWENKSDSINMIMSTYFNVYVPINLFPCLEEH